MREMSSILVLAVWTSLFLGPPVQEPGSRLEQYLKSQAHQNGFSGDVLIAKGDALLIKKSFGASSNLSTEVSQPQDRFPVGSIAEQFIAAAILQLELTGQVRLDSSICDYISDCPDSWKPIHILHLLTHSSGLPSLHEGSPCVERAVVKPRAIMAMLSARPMLFEPGDRFNLNRFDYFFLSAVIEKSSGQLTSEYLDQHIFRPLKLAQTGYSLPASEPQDTEAQTPAGCRPGELAANLVPALSGELYSSTGDLYRWNHALATEKFLPANSLRQMYTPYIDGYGFGLKILKEFDRKVAVQNNESGSNSVSIRMYPDDDTCIVVVSRVRETAAAELSHGLGALLFGKHSRVSSNPAAPNCVRLLSERRSAGYPPARR
jgi:CubicO group peptidase (beta-lactamase class C family)